MLESYGYGSDTTWNWKGETHFLAKPMCTGVMMGRQNTTPSGHSTAPYVQGRPKTVLMKVIENQRSIYKFGRPLFPHNVPLHLLRVQTRSLCGVGVAPGKCFPAGLEKGDAHVTGEKYRHSASWVY
jgi:hypothetical protein